MNWLLRGLAGTAFLLITSCVQPVATQRVFVTDYSLGLDKWATAWLLTKQLAPGAKLTVVAAGEALPGGTPFDVLSSPVRRQGNRAAFEVARDLYAITDPDVQRIAQIVNDIEVNFWAQEIASESPLIEQAFRVLQRGYGEVEVTPQCYVAFFEEVYNAVRDERLTGKAISMGDLDVSCATASFSSNSHALVPEVPIPEILAEMDRGKSVIFIDVREANEFAESHIPGARNITLRDLSLEAVSQVKHADYVVSYCVKDFRGFEMARALRESGVINSVILKPYGIKGWVAQGLPTAGAKTLGEAQAIARLANCVNSRKDCTSLSSTLQ